jgi:hypothetical protein
VPEYHEEMVDYESSSTWENKDVNIIYLSTIDYSLVGDDEVSQMDFNPLRCCIPEAYGHAIPSETLIYQGKSYKELIKTSMTINRFGEEEPIGVKGIASIELTMESKIVATAFFIADMQGNYSVILK